MTNQTQPPAEPITIYQNAHLFPDGAHVDLYVENGEITAIEKAGPLLPSGINLGGAYVYPGLRDAHCHLLGTAETSLGIDVASLRTIPDLIRRGQMALRGHPSGIIFQRINEAQFHEKRLPTMADLNQISKTVPVIAKRVCGHLAVVNSCLWEHLPAHARTATPGLIVEDNLRFLPRPHDIVGIVALEKALKAQIETLIRYGITAVSSNDLGNLASPEDEALLTRVLQGFPGFGYRSQYSPTLPFVAKELDHLITNASDQGVAAVKVFRDGSLGGRTALLRDDYHDAPGERGLETLDDQTHEAILRAANARGLQVMTHCIGDLALERTLDVIERTTGATNPQRHAIVHAQITDHALIERMARQHVLAIVQPSFIPSDAVMAPARLGPRYAHAYAFKTMADRGIHVSFSSDAPVESCSPLSGIAAAMNGVPGRPESRFSFHEAWAHYTQEGAYADLIEDSTGVLDVGFAADFLVFTHDLAILPAAELVGAKPLMTVMKGHLYRNFGHYNDNHR